MHNTVSMPLSPLQVGEGSGARHSIMPAGVLSSSIPLGTLILLGRVAAELSCSWAGREPREAGAVATDLPFFLSRANFPSGHGAGGNIRQAGWWQGHPPDMHERGRAAGTRARARALAVTAGLPGAMHGRRRGGLRAGRVRGGCLQGGRVSYGVLRASSNLG